MKHQSLVRLLLLLAVSCCTVYAQDSSKFDLSLSGSYLHVHSSPSSNLGTQSLYGGELSVSYKFKRPWLRLVGDFGLNTAGTRNSGIIGLPLSGSQMSFLAGPRLVLPLGRLSPFAQSLFGVAHADVGMFDTTSAQWPLHGRWAGDSITG
jgi:hypothetical protein